MSRNKPTSALARRSVTRREIKNPGAMKLRRDADVVVGNNSDKIAKALADEALIGNASSAKLLVDLADGADWVQNPEDVARVLSLASGWKEEPKFVRLELKTNPPKPRPEPPQLSDGS
jgi:hypothetical protein